MKKMGFQNIKKHWEKTHPFFCYSKSQRSRSQKPLGFLDVPLALQEMLGLPPADPVLRPTQALQLFCHILKHVFGSEKSGKTWKRMKRSRNR